MNTQLVVFDFDGTLADSFPWFLSILDELADRYRFKRIRPEDLTELRGMGSRELMSRLGVATWKLPFIARYMRAAKTRDTASVTLFPGVDGMLRRLAREGIQLAMVSSNSRANVERILGQRNAALIDHWQCGASLFGKAKAFRKVLARAAVKNTETLAVGDEIRDLEAAREVGLRFGAVTWGYTTREGMVAKGAELIFDHMEDIVETVLPTPRRTRSAAPLIGAPR